MPAVRNIDDGDDDGECGVARCMISNRAIIWAEKNTVNVTKD